jgi:hypothetical protein
MAPIGLSTPNAVNPNVVVRVVPGPSTGDLIVITANGARWLSVSEFPITQATGVRFGELINGIIREVW